MSNKNTIKPKDRAVALNARRNLKMARSAHAYVRGNTLKFYDWLESATGKALPEGPAIWICGDCHLGNLGPLANTKGRVDVQIRDLDQTVIGNPSHDLIRLALSLASAARGSDLPGVTTAKMMEEIMAGYGAAFDAHKDGVEEDIEVPTALAKALESSVKRSWKHLAEERIEDASPYIPLGKTFWPLTSEEESGIKVLFEGDHVRRLVTALKSRDDDADIRVRDAAYWRKGCSSLGRLRYAVLVEVEGKKGEKKEFSLIDIKEAAKPAAPAYPKQKMPRDHAERVVTGAKHLSPFLGDRMLAARLEDKPVFLRELMPQDLKADLEHLNRDEATTVARYLAHVVGKGHARQMDAATRKAWLGELKRDRTGKLDAPSWLWSSTVELIVSHEAAYLEHCRRYALDAEKA